MLLVVAGSLYGAGEWAIGYFGKIKAQEVITATIFANRGITDTALLQTKLTEALAQQGFEEFSQSELSVFLSEDAARIQVTGEFLHRRSLPLTDKRLTIPFEIRVEENLKAKSFQ
jgi:hypothetical protein